MTIFYRYLSCCENFLIHLFLIVDDLLLFFGSTNISTICSSLQLFNHRISTRFNLKCKFTIDTISLVWTCFIDRSKNWILFKIRVQEQRRVFNGYVKWKKLKENEFLCEDIHYYQTKKWRKINFHLL